MKKKPIRKVGRPRKYSTVVELEKAIEQFFKQADKPTITGLALHLGFSSRADLIRNEGFSPEYHYALKKAKLRVENFYESQLIKPNNSGAIFALKNFDWRDKQELEHSGSIQIPKLVIDDGSKH